MPYLKQANRIALFEEVYRQLQKVSPRWTAHREHGAVLRSFQEIGGLELCPEVVQLKILRWLVLVYLGEPGGRTTYGNVRQVFYSNSGAPLVIEIIKAARLQVRQLMIHLNDDREILKACKNEYVAARWKELLDLVEPMSVCKSSV